MKRRSDTSSPRDGFPLFEASGMADLVPIERVQSRILVLRGERVLIDADLADLFGVATKALNQAVKRNQERFPPEFMFRLTAEEMREVVTICDHLRPLKFSHARPSVFTEHGALMAANVLNSPRAILASVAIVKAFVVMRRELASHRDLARKLADLEKKYDTRFRVVFTELKKLMHPPDPPRPRIGFRPGREGGGPSGRRR